MVTLLCLRSSLRKETRFSSRLLARSLVVSFSSIHLYVCFLIDKIRKQESKGEVTFEVFRPSLDYGRVTWGICFLFRNCHI